MGVYYSGSRMGIVFRKEIELKQLALALARTGKEFKMKISWENVLSYFLLYNNYIAYS